MSRPIVHARIAGKELSAILDTGSRRSYIRTELARRCPAAPVQPFQVRLGGQTLDVDEGKVVSGEVQDSSGRCYLFTSVVFPVDDLGEEDGGRIDLLVGALLLEDWGAVIDESATPPQVDYRLLREGELVEL